MNNIATRVIEGKQPAHVRGNIIRCINYVSCPLCYGCRAYDSRDPECVECNSEDQARGKKFHICNTNLHQAVHINKLITKNKIDFENEEITFINGGN